MSGFADRIFGYFAILQQMSGFADRIFGYFAILQQMSGFAVSTTRVSTKERAAVVEWKLKGRIRKNPTDEVYITSLVQTHHN